MTDYRLKTVNCNIRKLGLYIDRNRRRQTCLRRSLECLRIELHTVCTIQKAKEMIEEYDYHLVIMHFDTVGKQIFRFCSFTRDNISSGIVIVLMAKPKIHIEEQLFDCGASDVVAGRQVLPRVLTKRIQAFLHNTGSSLWYQNYIKLKGAIIDLDRREVRRNGSCYQLRGILADLLKYFLDNPNRVITREELEKTPIWADSICTPAKEGGKTFDVNVGKLRKLIEPDPAQPQIIISVRGVGWKMEINSIERPHI